MTAISALDKFVSVVYIKNKIIPTEHDDWGAALIAAETPFLKKPRSWSHGPRDKGHWVLNEVARGSDIIMPALLAIIFLPHNVVCCDYHGR